MQAKDIGNIFNKVIAGNFPNLEKAIAVRYKNTLGHKTDTTKIEPYHSKL
jgi:hypothetical protein